MRLFLLALILIAAGISAPNDSLDSGELSPIARSLLAQKMEGHAISVAELQWGVIFLESEEVERIARHMADEPRLARPIKGNTYELNDAIPLRFFDLQDGMTKRAKALADTAKEGDVEAIALRYGELMQSCVACHAAFLDD